MESNLAYEYESWDELIDGKIVAMSPRPTVSHNFVSGNIYTIFSNYLKGKKCVPFADGTDLHLNNKERYVPDGMIVCDKDKIRINGVYGSPDLVIEVLSPSTAKNDRGHKKDIYESAGVPEYWIVNPADKTIEVYLLNDGRYRLDNVYCVYPDYMLEKMTDQEKATLLTEFRCHLFNELTIRPEDVFDRVE